MPKKREFTVKVIKVGNSIGVLLPKKDIEFKDIEPYKDWLKIQINEVIR